MKAKADDFIRVASDKIIYFDRLKHIYKDERAAEYKYSIRWIYVTDEPGYVYFKFLADRDSMYDEVQRKLKQYENSKGGFKPMETLKNYFEKHQETFITLGIIVLIDEFLLNGSLRGKLQSLIERIMASTEKKLLGDTAEDK